VLCYPSLALLCLPLPFLLLRYVCKFQSSEVQVSAIAVRGNTSAPLV